MVQPARRRAVQQAHRWLHTSRYLQRPAPKTSDPAGSASGQHPDPSDDTSTPHTLASDNPHLTGAARLLAQALEEEEGTSRPSSSRDHLVHSQGPIWTGDESQSDAVLRMLVDAHKPLRTGEGIKSTASEDKIKRWMKEIDLKPKQGAFVTAPVPSDTAESTTPHRTTIPPHLHRPWHSTYTGDSQVADDSPKVKYGTFTRKRADADALANILELQLPQGADAKTRARVRENRKRSRLVGRMESAREKALDYQLDIDEDAETFEGNRQLRGSSVLGAGRGNASGLRAWAGLVEDRIQRAKEAGFFNVTQGRGKPIPRDPNAGNPHLELGELMMNRIIKKQGALPPWIELQNNLDQALNAFRQTLLTTYANHVIRSVISTHSLHPLPPYHVMPSRDEAWEAREHKFHAENIKQINDLVRKMNTLAPSPARRHLVTLEYELDRVRGDVLRQEVWQGIKDRAEAVRMVPPPTPNPIPFQASLQKLKQAASRSLSTLASTGSSSSGGDALFGNSRGQGGNEHAEHAEHTGPRRYGVIVLLGLGAVAFIHYRRPARADSQEEDMLASPSSDESAEDIATKSPAEPRSSPFEIIRIYVFEPIFTFFRFCHLLALFGPVILTAPMILVGRTEKRRRNGKPISEEEENWGAVWWYGFLVKQMERAGPSFIKLGQWAASRADLFPATLCDKMSKLHSNGEAHSIHHTRRVIQKAFELDFDDIFEEFDTKPIGCGAIAQVYKARLKPEILGVKPDDQEALSTSVAIKVLHPRVRKTINRDITIMSLFANMINAIPGMEWISLPEEVAVFGEMMRSQLDLRVEATNLERFNTNFRRRGRRVTFPRPIKLGRAANGDTREESREVLMEEYEDALPLKYFLRNGGGDYDDMIANIGLDAFLEMLLLDNFTHGDLHPGNIMVRFYKPTTRDYISPLLSRLSSSPPPEAVPHHSLSDDELVDSLAAIAHDSDEWHSRLEDLARRGYEPQLVFIDAGLVTSLDSVNRRNFLELFQAVAEFDGYKAGKLMVERCRTPEYVVDEETFALKMQHLVLSVKSKTFSLAKIKISDILTDVLTAVRQHHVKLEGDFVNTVISILLLEGIGRQLDPNMDLFKSALPILRQLGRQMGTREAISMAPKGNLWAMVKLWVWVEAREVAGQASAIDEWVKFDRLAPAI
ncbi:ABC1 family-domain-containing protein [Kockovaella imperatae]|uniref:ABC1 family-domain-containing protein n=1 Tax=Kockovaella imperatae TaxID=4999 RepID=A0A1Y1UTB5_9TREE|nr:ABC1 family-domain-containing protein [Kockovaella imperatae]ORX41269.1 ABC1 family-domain-containing protein [Kockovaella imperatae]